MEKKSVDSHQSTLLQELFCLSVYLQNVYGSQCWTIKAKPKLRIVAVEIKVGNDKILGYNWIDYKTNT